MKRTHLPLNGLRVLDAAARHLSFTRAADELAVTPAHGRRGVGRALVDEVLAWSAAQGLPSVTLITFRDVPWNGPFYEKLGFEAVTALTPALQALLDQSATWGVPRDVVMRRSLVDAESADA